MASWMGTDRVGVLQPARSAPAKGAWTVRRVVGADSASTRRCNLAYSSTRAHSKGAAYEHRSTCEVLTAARRRGQSPCAQTARAGETIVVQYCR